MPGSEVRNCDENTLTRQCYKSRDSAVEEQRKNAVSKEDSSGWLPTVRVREAVRKATRKPSILVLRRCYQRRRYTTCKEIHRCKEFEINCTLLQEEECPTFELSSVLAKEITIIPPNSECLAQGIVEVPGQFRYVVIDFASQNSGKVSFVAALFIDLKREVIYVRVLNLDNNQWTLEKGAVIVMCKPVVDTVPRSQKYSKSQNFQPILDNLEGLTKSDG
ncbi:uncharacterized protein NPIL_272331 [Nephila pilipes]|uniref:Uncharacterized protein n=1 Tax=Nephila pilipes TaxID=299642 RepID=A0A8X6UH04_NEPPI|nr:uncharacterized protein NPIL_272331 [Nephila pilipes]